jgi:hypothetical protein
MYENAIILAKNGNQGKGLPSSIAKPLKQKRKI